MSRDGDSLALRRYLGFLTEQGDARSEALHLYLLLTESPIDDDVLGVPRVPAPSELRSRLRAQLARVDEAWWHAVANAPEIYSCGSAGRDAPLRVKFSFRCPNNWETLEPTTHDDRRFCISCGEHVHWAGSLARAEALARQGACISVPAVLASAKAAELTMHTTGRPDWRTLWATRLFGGDRDD